MDYGKFRYEEAQKAKEARRKSTNVTIKEVKFRPKIGKGDFDTKVRRLVEFIDDGHKVKVTLQFRGREMAHPELGTKILDNVIETVGPMAKVENHARMEGRSMSMVLAPDKKAQEAMKKAAADQEQKEAKEAKAAADAAAEAEALDAEAGAPEAEAVALDAEAVAPDAEAGAPEAEAVAPEAEAETSVDEAPPET